MTDTKKTEEKKEEGKSLTKISEVTTKKFFDKVNERIVSKYADSMIVIIEDQKKLEKALKFVNKIVAAVEAGDFTAIEKYKKARHRLETEENAEYE